MKFGLNLDYGKHKEYNILLQFQDHNSEFSREKTISRQFATTKNRRYNFKRMSFQNNIRRIFTIRKLNEYVVVQGHYVQFSISKAVSSLQWWQR